MRLTSTKHRHLGIRRVGTSWKELLRPRQLLGSDRCPVGRTSYGDKAGTPAPPPGLAGEPRASGTRRRAWLPTTGGTRPKCWSQPLRAAGFRKPFLVLFLLLLLMMMMMIVLVLTVLQLYGVSKARTAPFSRQKIEISALSKGRFWLSNSYLA